MKQIQFLGRCATNLRAAFVCLGWLHPGSLGLWCCGLLAASLAGWAAPPVNDQVSGAITIPSAGPFPHYEAIQDVLEATTAGDPLVAPACQTNVYRSIWYVFTPASTELYTFSTCSENTTVSDTVIGLYSSPTGTEPFEFLGCADDASGACFRKAALTAELEQNTRYYILIWQFNARQSASGEDNAFVQLIVSQTAKPANDTCADAQPLQLDLPVAGTTLGAENNYQLAPNSSCYGSIASVLKSTAPGRDVVYTFRAPEAGKYSIRVSNFNTANEDVVLYISPTCPANGSPATVSCFAAANRVPYGTAEEIYARDLAANQLIYIFVDDASDPTESAGSNFIIEVNKCRQEVENNNSIAGANAIACGTEGSIGSNYDEDYFSLGTFPAGSRAFVMLNGVAASPTSFTLELLSGDTNVVEIDTGDNDAAFGDMSPNIAGAILPAQPAYVAVANAVKSEPYRLYAVVQPPKEQATLESEPNEYYNEGSFGPNNYFTGTLDSRVDVDCFWFTASATDLIMVNLDCDPLRNNTPFNGKLELLDANGKVLVSVDDDQFLSSTNPIAPNSPGEGLLYRCSESGDYFARVSVSPNASGQTAMGDYLLSISKNCIAGGSSVGTAPSLHDVVVSSPVDEGTSATLTGRISDPNTGEAFSITVDWGDGCTPTMTNITPGLYTFSISHHYSNNPPAEVTSGEFAINMTVTDLMGQTASTNLSAHVNNVVPTAPGLALNPLTIAENGSAGLVVAFMDPGLQDSHVVTINWGDNSPNTVLNLSPGEFRTSVTTHRYLDDSPSGTGSDIYTIEVTVADDVGISPVASTQITVTNIAPTLSDLAITSPVVNGQAATLTGTVSDTGSIDVLSVRVDWGDGPPQTTVISGNSFSLQHVYTIGNTNHSVQAQVLDDDGGSSSVSTVAIRVDQALAVEPQLSVLWEGGVLRLRLTGTVGIAYRVESSTILPNWNPAGTLTPGSNGTAEMTLAGDGPARFYRAVFP